MIEKLDYHDASIIKIEHHLKENKLVLGIVLHDSRHFDMIFEDVIGWDFSPFDFQNFLFDFRIYDHDKVPKSIIDDYEVNERYVDIMISKKSFLFVVDPAAGMGGYVIAQDLKVVSL